MGERRKYSVDEIDAMRADVKILATGQSPFGWRGPGTTEVEDRLRTFMLNGTCPSELRSAAEKKMDNWRIATCPPRS